MRIDSPSAATPDRRSGHSRKPPRPQRVFVVSHSERISAHLVRVHLGGPDFRPFVDEADPARLASTDRYVKILIAAPELGLTPPFDLEALRQTRRPEELPAQRTYTVRGVDLESETISIDFVIHGDDGVAGPWAASARPGDLLALSGPGGGYRPSGQSAVTYLFFGDDSAIPAIAGALEALPPDASGTTIIEVDGPADEIALPSPADMTVLWSHRTRAPGLGSSLPGDALVEAVRLLAEPTGVVEVFAHGERGSMQSIRGILQDDWGIERRSMSLSAYWAFGRAEDRFQAEKREPVGIIFAD